MSQLQYVALSGFHLGLVDAMCATLEKQGWNFVNVVAQEWGQKGLLYDKSTEENRQRVFVPLPSDRQQPLECLQSIQARQLDLARRGFSVVQVLPEGVVYHDHSTSVDDFVRQRGAKRSRRDFEAPTDEDATESDDDRDDDAADAALEDGDETQPPWFDPEATLPDPEPTQLDAEPTQLDPS